jgi:hypothetical protein
MEHQHWSFPNKFRLLRQHKIPQAMRGFDYCIQTIHHQRSCEVLGEEVCREGLEVRQECCDALDRMLEAEI